MPFRQDSRDVKWNKLLIYADSPPFQASSLGAGPEGGHRDREEEEEEEAEESGDASGRGGGRRILDRPPVKKVELTFSRFPYLFFNVLERDFCFLTCCSAAETELPEYVLWDKDGGSDYEGQCLAVLQEVHTHTLIFHISCLIFLK